MAYNKPMNSDSQKLRFAPLSAAGYGAALGYKNMHKIIFIISLVFSMSGCAGYSMHTMHDVEIRVSDYASKKPAGNVEVSFLYDYDSYGWFYFANTPAPVSGVTDNAGKVVLSLADYRYRILMRVGGSGTDLNKEMVRKGGTVAVPGKAPVYMVELRPR